MSASITLEFTVAVGYAEGDYTVLHGNGGSGDIDWDSPLNNNVYPLFPFRAGNFGWGNAPWGYFPWGHLYSMRTLGWGHAPWGHFPWGHGAVVITVVYRVDDCGAYKFAFACYDPLGNLHEGTPEEVTLHIHIAPAAPTGLKKVSYDPDTDILVLAAA